MLALSFLLLHNTKACFPCLQFHQHCDVLPIVPVLRLGNYPGSLLLLHNAKTCFLPGCSSTRSGWPQTPRCMASSSAPSSTCTSRSNSRAGASSSGPPTWRSTTSRWGLLPGDIDNEWVRKSSYFESYNRRVSLPTWRSTKSRWDILPKDLQITGESSYLEIFNK